MRHRVRRIAMVAMFAATTMLLYAASGQTRDCSLRCTDDRGRTTHYLTWLCPDTRACSGSCATRGVGCVPIVVAPPDKPAAPPKK